MKSVFLLALIIFSAAGISAPVKNVIYNDEQIERPSVSDTGTFSVTPSKGVRNRGNTPRNSTAGRLTQDGKLFLWKPSQIKGKATGGADLINALVSKDETLLVIAERVGGTNQNNSTRLIFFNMHSKKIVGGHLLAERRISDIAFIPGTDELLAIQNAQPEFQNKDAVIRIDLHSGKVTAVSASAKDRITSFCTDGRKVWYTVKNTMQIFEFSLKNFSAPPAEIQTRTADPRAAMTPNLSRLIVCGKGQVEYYTISGQRTAGLADTTDIVGSDGPAEILVLNNQGTLLLLNEPEEKALLFNNGTPRTVADKTAGAMAYFKNKNALLISVMKQNAFLHITLPEGELAEKPVQPGKLKPLSRNSTWKLIPLASKEIKAVLIDHRGNIMLLEKTKRRWRKHVLLTVDKTGYR